MNVLLYSLANTINSNYENTKHELMIIILKCFFPIFLFSCATNSNTRTVTIYGTIYGNAAKEQEDQEVNVDIRAVWFTMLK